MTIFGNCWPMPVESIDWARWAGFKDRDVDFAGWNARLGISIIRMFNFTWVQCEPSPGVYNFDSAACPLGDSLRKCQAAGLKVYINPSTLSQPAAPEWHRKGKDDLGRPLIDADAFTRWVVALVRYCLQFLDSDGKPIVVLWGYGNENDSAFDEIGGLAEKLFNGDWDPCARHQFAQYTLPFAKAVRSVLPDATICGPETMTYGYAASMLKAENGFLATSASLMNALWPYARPVTDMVSVHGYAMGGRFPADALRRLSGPGDTITGWLPPDVLRGRKRMIGEWGLEHVDTIDHPEPDRPENPDDMLDFMSAVAAMRDPQNPSEPLFEYAFAHDLDHWLTKIGGDDGRPTVPKSLVPNGRYWQFKKRLGEIYGRRRGVRS